jgi:hypothetical protein
MDAKTSRTEKIRLLVAEAGGPTRFAETFGAGRWTQAKVSQWVSDSAPKGIGHKLARAIEQATGKPAGWLDSLSGAAHMDDAQLLLEEMDELRACLRAFAAGMAIHRPAEGADVASALRSLSDSSPFAQELAEALVQPGAALRAR